MHFQIWNFFYRPEVYSEWKARINHEHRFNYLTWQKISYFLGELEVNSALSNKLLHSHSLEDFVAKAKENSQYSFTQDELAWVVITSNEIWNFLELAEETRTIKEQLLLARNPQEFINIAIENGYKFYTKELGYLLTEIKSSPSVGISNSFGAALTTPIIGKIITGCWIDIAEKWGLVPPFCHRDQPNTSLFSNEDLLNPQYYLRKCFLPKGYFNQRLMSYS
ncbi:MAG: Nif11-like leader peptide family natural product precursor [Goleter apudmare HA4340-LM2]|jgi:hypothetical protein|nr:Nif11-like leader peptide family natural product precursor [Goleter apudmare HA4340-LM2]